MRHLGVILAFCLPLWFATPAHSRTPERRSSFSYGVEWGYTSTLMHIYHNNYFAEEGYRIDKSGIDACFNSNGQLLAHIGVNAWDKFNFSTYFGYIGIKQDRRIMPLTLRATYYFNSFFRDGYMIFADNGLGIHDAEHNTFIGKYGAGYRLALSRRLNLDLMVSIQIANDHPTLYDPEEKEIPKEDLRRNDATYGALNFNIALSF